MTIRGLRIRMSTWIGNLALAVAPPPEPITVAQIREAVKQLEKHNIPPDDCPTCGRQVYMANAKGLLL